MRKVNRYSIYYTVKESLRITAHDLSKTAIKKSLNFFLKYYFNDITQIVILLDSTGNNNNV